MQYRCSFCGKHQDEVKRLIAGPGAVYICDECVELCREIIEEDGGEWTKEVSIVHCSFCGKGDRAVPCIVLGPQQPGLMHDGDLPRTYRRHPNDTPQWMVCNECLESYQTIIEQECESNVGEVPSGKLVVLHGGVLTRHIVPFAYACSFCATPQEQVSLLLVKFGKGCICDKCVARGRAMVEAARQAKDEGTDA